MAHEIAREIPDTLYVLSNAQRARTNAHKLRGNLGHYYYYYYRSSVRKGHAPRSTLSTLELGGQMECCEIV